jgi:hypothetical protein
MNDMVSIRKMRPLEPACSAGVTMVEFEADDLAALAGLAALETGADFGVFFVDGK